jgi:hypothetical protein
MCRFRRGDACRGKPLFVDRASYAKTNARLPAHNHDGIYAVHVMTQLGSCHKVYNTKIAAPRAGGFVIDFWGLGYDIAERMGLVPALKAHGYNVRELRFVNDHGQRVGGFGADVFRALTNGRYVSLRQSDLAKLIYDKIDDPCGSDFRRWRC